MSHTFSSSTTHNAGDRSIRILIVDDQRLVRARVEEVLAQRQELEIVGMAHDGQNAIAMIESLQPDVVLMDIEMPQMDGIAVTEVVAQKFPNSKILVISTHEKEEYIQKVINAGADGYLLKQTPALDLVEAIHAVSKGYSHFGPQILKKVRLALPPGKISESINPQNYPPQQTNSDDYCRLNDQQPPARSTRKQASLVEQSEDQINLDPDDVDPDLNTIDDRSLARTAEFNPARKPWPTWAGVAAILLVSVVIPLASTIKYKSKVQAPLLVSRESQVKAVVASIEGQVAQILAQPGNKINQGDAIATIDRTAGKMRLERLQQAIAQGNSQLNQLDSRLTAIDKQMETETQSNRAELELVEAELTSGQYYQRDRNIAAQNQLDTAQASLKAAKARRETAQNKLARYQSVGEAGALSQELIVAAKLDLVQRQQEVATAKAELQSASASLNTDSNQLEVAQQKIATVKESGRVAIANLNQDRAGLLQQRLEIEHQLEQNKLNLKQLNRELEQVELTASATGTVAQLNLSNPGQNVELGQEIAQIAVGDGKLTLTALISSQDINQIQSGQPVAIKQPFCDDRRNGILTGKVTQVPQTISQSETVARSNISPTPSTYEVTVTPDDAVAGENNGCSLESDMTTMAEIVTREELVLQYIWRRVTRFGDV